ncbi:hypothetical protein AKJ09_07062 [Labilithrix luteola]|uniref:Uncharacterized protein n=1 Tax=Labilithrix luteola TaxID=1391654 RepID=A0A0K1Q3U2_9BACT|nr:hypothetical protein [Labilithrix luteola]AKV00399.1 hypothetical protein AKJ09_07062 [Labilithrix luteola]
MLSNLVSLKSWRAKAPAFIASLALLTACSSSDDTSSPGGGGGGASYPRQVTIEYRVTSPALKEADVIFTNATGGMDNLDKQALPFSKTFTRTVNQADYASVSPTSTVGGTLEASVLVDGKEVEKKTFSGTSVATGSAVYVFQ